MRRNDQKILVSSSVSSIHLMVRVNFGVRNTVQADYLVINTACIKWEHLNNAEVIVGWLTSYFIWYLGLFLHVWIFPNYFIGQASSVGVVHVAIYIIGFSQR